MVNMSEVTWKCPTCKLPGKMTLQIKFENILLTHLRSKNGQWMWSSLFLSHLISLSPSFPLFGKPCHPLFSKFSLRPLKWNSESMPESCKIVYYQWLHHKDRHKICKKFNGYWLPRQGLFSFNKQILTIYYITRFQGDINLVKLQTINHSLLGLCVLTLVLPIV